MLDDVFLVKLCQIEQYVAESFPQTIFFFFFFQTNKQNVLIFWEHLDLRYYFCAVYSTGCEKGLGRVLPIYCVSLCVIGLYVTRLIPVSLAQTL